MDRLLKVITDGVMLALFGTAVISWVCISIYGFHAVRNSKLKGRLFSRHTLWNPANVLLFPDCLTASGRMYRRKCGISVLVFLGTLLVSWIWSLLTR